jgi:hypothetical protein
MFQARLDARTRMSLRDSVDRESRVSRYGAEQRLFPSHQAMGGEGGRKHRYQYIEA